MNDTQYVNILEEVSKLVEEQRHEYEGAIVEAQRLSAKIKGKAYLDVYQLLKRAQINCEDTYECADERV